MRLTEIAYDAFAEDHFPDMRLVRAFRDCKIWSAGVDKPLLVLVDDVNQRLAVFEYDSGIERARDIDLVRRMQEEDGGGSAGIPAALRPAPSPRSPGYAQQPPADRS